MMTQIKTVPLPPSIPANCAAGANPQASELAGLGWTVHPADYDPAEITAEDRRHDCSLRGLSLDEAIALESML